jgi:hypothetical protein
MKAKRKPDPKGTMYHILVTGEGGDFMIRVPKYHRIELKKLTKAYMKTGEWDQRINDIINIAARVTPVGIINTSGDGGGWYEYEEE